MKSLSKIIYAILFIAILLKAFKTLYAQNNAEFIAAEEVYDWYFRAGYYGNILITLAAILSFVLYRKYFPLYVSVCYLLMILLVTITSLGDIDALIEKPGIFYSVKGIGTYANFGILFFAAHSVYFPKILKLFYYICFAFIIAGLINLNEVGFEASRMQYLDAIKKFAVYLIWVFPFFLLQNEENRKLNLLNFVIYGLILIFVLSTGSRSYLLIYAIFFIVKLKDQFQTRNRLILVAGSLILITGGSFLFAQTGVGNAVGGAVNNFTERLTEDSRSGQLSEFLSQYDTDYLIKGVGPFGTWNWSHWPTPYYYLDNQFLLLAWWAGLPTLIVYLFYLVKPVLKKGQILVFENIQGVRLIIGFWVLACAGLAIYVGISSELYHDFITLLIGLQTCKYTLLLSDAEEET